MKGKILTTILIFLIGVIFFTALYIVFGTLGDYRSSQAMGNYTQQMYVRDMAYMRIHKLPFSLVGLIIYSLGYISKIIIDWVLGK